jgi:hypothetical protein
MDSWGYKLFDNDFTMILKEEIEFYLDSRIPTHFIISELSMIIPFEELDEKKRYLVWIVVGYTFWLRGFKSTRANQKALSCIEQYFKKIDISNESTQILFNELNMIKEKLLSHPPKMNKIRLKYVCSWKIGDVYSYPISNDLYGEHQLNGEYFLIHKVGENKDNKNNTYPVVEIKVTSDGVLPSSKEEIDKLDYVVVSRMEPTFNSHGGINIKDQLKPNYVLDENGYLRFYQFEISGNSINDLPKNIRYIGNFTNLKPPIDANYYLPQYATNQGCHWRHFENLIAWFAHFHFIKEYDSTYINKFTHIKSFKKIS